MSYFFLLDFLAFSFFIFLLSFLRIFLFSSFSFLIFFFSFLILSFPSDADIFFPVSDELVEGFFEVLRIGFAFALSVDAAFVLAFAVVAFVATFTAGTARRFFWAVALGLVVVF